MHQENQLEAMCARVSEWIARAEREPIGVGAFEPMALEVFRFQYERNRAYRAACQAAGRTPDNVRSLFEIPAIVTSAFKEQDLSVLAPAERTTVFHSSGTTGQQPSRHFHSAATLEVYERSLRAWFRPHLLHGLTRARFVHLTPPPREAPHSSLVHMLWAVSQAGGDPDPVFAGQLTPDGAWILDAELLRDEVAAAADSGLPIVFCGTAFSFVQWCDALADSPAEGPLAALPPGSRVLETGGYKGRSRSIPKAELHRLTSERLGLPEERIVSEYGMSELSSQAYDRVAGESGPRVFRFPPWAAAAVVSPESGRPVAEGESGLIRVWDLANIGSVMAVQTEDLAVRHGAGFALLGRAALAEPRGCSWQAA